MTKDYQKAGLAPGSPEARRRLPCPTHRRTSRRPPGRLTEEQATLPLAAEIPAPVLADMLGLTPHTAIRWAALAARDWSLCTGLRAKTGDNGG
jgi:hypothetical protein